MPTAVVAIGCILIAPVILCSPLTSGWTASRRNAVYLGFAAGVLLCVTLAAKIAAAGMEKASF